MSAAGRVLAHAGDRPRRSIGGRAAARRHVGASYGAWRGRAGHAGWLRPAVAAVRRGSAGVALVRRGVAAVDGALAEESFTGHMVQHLLVIIVAAPLLVLARPVHTSMRGRLDPGDGRPAGAIGALWHRYAAGRSARRCSSSCCSSPTSRRSTTGPSTTAWLHELEHAAYLLGAVRDVGGRARRRAQRAPWRGSVAVFGVDRRRRLARHDPAVGDRAADPDLRGAPRRRARRSTTSARRRRSCGSAGMLTTVPLLVLAVWRWASTEERIARRAEALADAATDRRRAEAARRSSRRPAPPPVTVTAVTSSPWASSTQ